jgi:hypothetical protein
MNRFILLPIVALLLTGASFQCKPNRVEPPQLTGKLVVNAACGHYVVEVLSGNVDSARLVRSWKDSASDTTYTNVFAVSNACTFSGFGLSRGDIFTFTMNDTVIVQNCMLCMIFYPKPPVSNFVNHVRVLQRGGN